LARGPRKKQLTPELRKVAHFFGLATKQYEKKNYAQAERLCRSALKIREDAAQVRLLLGRALIGQGQHAEAVKELERTLEDHPDPNMVKVSLATAYASLEQFEPALRLLRECCEAKPQDPLAWLGYGNVLYKVRRFDEAHAALLKAAAVAEAQGHKVPSIYSNHGAMLTEMGRLDEAILVLRKGMEIDPEDAVCTYNAFFAARQKGLLIEAMELFELGFTAGNRKPFRFFKKVPRWRGENAADKRLLVWREQGIGDEIIHAALYPWVIGQAGHVRIETTDRFLDLFRRSFPDAEVAIADHRGDLTRTDVDYQIPAGAIPIVVGDNAAVRQMYNQAEPWLRPDPGRAAFWKERIAALGPGLKVGLCWRSMKQDVMRRPNYFDAAAQGGPLFKIPGITWVNMQYDDCAEELAAVREQHGITLHDWDDIDLKDDLDGVVAMMHGLDLVITVGTAVQWLAIGAGTPTWGLHIGAEQPLSPPRQEFFDPPSALTWRRHWTESWDSVLVRVSERLQRVASGQPVEAVAAG